MRIDIMLIHTARWRKTQPEVSLQRVIDLSTMSYGSTKILKRQVFGRAHLDLLRIKVLHAA